MSIQSVWSVVDLDAFGPVASLLVAVSLAMLIVGAVLAPIVIVRLPADYFVRPDDPAHSGPRGPLRLVLHVLKNVCGVILLLAGIAMLVLPGQGILTIFCGISLLNFPGKRRLEQRLLSISAVHRVVELIRSKAGRPPLQLESPAPEQAREERS